MTWPPLCGHCNTQHIHSCEDAQDARVLIEAINQTLIEAIKPATPIPESLRGPNWSRPTRR